MDTPFENNKQSMLKPAMNYGLFFGAILVAFSVLTWALNMTLEKYVGYISYIIMIACLFFFTKKYRDDYSNGLITYGKAFKFSALLLVFASFISGFYAFIFYKFIEPGMIDLILEKAREAMMESSTELSEEQIDMAIDMQRKFMTPVMMFIFGILGTYLMGLLFSLITCIFVKKKDNSIPESPAL
jgi:hypothetical protein